MRPVPVDALYGKCKEHEEAMIRQGDTNVLWYPTSLTRRIRAHGIRIQDVRSVQASQTLLRLDIDPREAIRMGLSPTQRVFEPDWIVEVGDEEKPYSLGRFSVSYP